MLLTDLPEDVLVAILGKLLLRCDLAQLGRCSKQLARLTHEVLEKRGLVMRSKHAALLPAWTGAGTLLIRGTPRRYSRGPQTALPLLPPFANLTSLHLRHCRMPAGQRFWAHVFEACPRLHTVGVVNDFFVGNYASDVHHCLDLALCGAHRLKSLDIEGSWMVLYPVQTISPGMEDAHAAVTRAHALPPVATSTLEVYRTTCRQVPLAVDSPCMRRLVVDERHEPPLVLDRMGPMTRASCRELVWKVSGAVFDGAQLRSFRQLASLDLRIDTSKADRASQCLAALAHLPCSLRCLKLVLDTWLMSWDDSGVAWGRPLEHLHALEQLHIEVRAPPKTVPDLLAHWMGAPPAGLTRVGLAFMEDVDAQFEYEITRQLSYDADAPDVAHVRSRWDTAAAPIDPMPLLIWLEAAPRCHLAVHNLGALDVRHPRVTLAHDNAAYDLSDEDSEDSG